MTRGRTTSWSTAALASGLLLLMWAAAAGPVGVLSPSGRELEFQPPPPEPTPVDSGGTTENPSRADEGRRADPGPQLAR